MSSILELLATANNVIFASPSNAFAFLWFLLDLVFIFFYMWLVVYPFVYTQEIAIHPHVVWILGVPFLFNQRLRYQDRAVS